MSGAQKRNVCLFICAYLFFILLMDYPYLARIRNDYVSAKVMQDYTQNALTSDTDSVLERARLYNAALSSGQVSLKDAFDSKGQSTDEVYNTLLSVDETGVMGSIEIPKIDLSLPIYHGVSDDTLLKGVGHLPGSSLPIGGESTHTVLSAHRGLPEKTLFTNLDLLDEGDIIYLHVLRETLAYRVYYCEEVLPTDVEHLSIQGNADLLTLVTCTPYGINTHRLYVHALRVPYEEAKAEKTEGFDFLVYAKLHWWEWATVLLIIACIITVRIYLRPAKNKRHKAQ